MRSMYVSGPCLRHCGCGAEWVSVVDILLVCCGLEGGRDRQTSDGLDGGCVVANI